MLASAVLFVTAAAAHARQAPQAQQPIFRSGTSVVEVTVIVRDRDGRFVRGLTKDDFEVLEGDIARNVESVYLVEQPDAGASPAPPGTDPAAIAPASRRTFVFLFDTLSPAGLTRAREAAAEFASRQLLPTDLSAAAALDISQSGRVSGNHHATIEVIKALKPRVDRLSREREIREWPRILSPVEASEINANIRSTIDRITKRACEEREMSCGDDASSPAGSGGRPSKEAFGADANRNQVEQELRRKAIAYVVEGRAAAERSLGALTQLAAALENLHGRKTIVWFTEGAWPEEMAERARQTAFRAAQSGVAVYTIDPRGLGRQTERSMDVAPADVGQAFLQDLDDLSNLMAAGSGGLFIRNENNLDRALARVEDDTSTYYVVGYAPGEGEDRSEYRQLSVRLRREGLSARVRHGFMAPKRVTATAGSLVATELAAAPGTRADFPAPSVALAPPPPPPAAASGELAASVRARDAGERAADDASNVRRLRGLSGRSNENAADLAARGWSAYERGDLETALPLFQQAAAHPDVQPWALYALGLTHTGLGSPRDAIAVWQRVRAAEPNYEPVYMDLAATYASLGDLSSALSMLREAEQRWPDDAEVHNGIGVILVRREALDDAIEAFTKAAAAAPDEAVTHLNLGRAYELRYMRDLRFVSSQQRWVAPEEDRKKAAASYERCVALGGPYAKQAADALSRLAWSSK